MAQHFPKKPRSTFLIRNILIIIVIAAEDLNDMIKDALSHRPNWNDYLAKKKKIIEIFAKFLKKKLISEVIEIEKIKENVINHMNQI